MKRTKTLLVLLLAALLASGIGVPATAADASGIPISPKDISLISGGQLDYACEITFVLKDGQGDVADSATIRSNVYNVYILSQWRYYDNVAWPEDFTIPYGETFTLRIGVDAPEGIEVSYAWTYWARFNSQTEGSVVIRSAKGPELRCAPGDLYYPNPDAPYLSAKREFLCDITLVEKDAEGNAIHTETFHKKVTVTMEPEREKNLLETIWTDYIVAPAANGYGIALWGILLTGPLGMLLFPVVFLVGGIVSFFMALFS